MVTKNGTRAKEGPQMPPAFYRALDTANLLVQHGRATRVLVQNGKVFVEGGTCAGCGDDGRGLPLLVDEPNQGNPWCPGCGGLALVALDVEQGLTFDNGLCRLQGLRVIHLVAPPVGEHPLCMPGALVGRMQPVPGDDTEPTCKRCLASAAGSLDGVYDRTIPVRGGTS